ncbi:MAG: alpha/beta hydrolase [Candidatus Eremiobacteraeota bacterium]|nr:alpha/beta hydrolase [Candidatus Eremiobacteraeota bacterium]
MIETMWTPASDGVLAGARTGGDTGEAIFFVHGVGSTAAIWDYQLDALCDRYRCYAIELRGNGAAENDPDPSVISREGFARDVLAVADAAEIGRFHLVGCSLGGVVGFELWRHAPGRIASMTIVGSFARYPDNAQYAAAIIANVSAAESLEAFARERGAKVLPPGAPPRRIEETISQMGDKSLPCYIASTHATWTGDYRNELGSITVPALVVCGELDPIAPRALSEEIADGIPGARLEVVAGAGHVVNADTPELFNLLLTAFLARSESFL